MTMTLWRSIPNLYVGAAKGSIWSGVTEFGGNNAFWTASSTTTTGTGAQTYDIDIVATDFLGDADPIYQVATTTLVDPFASASTPLGVSVGLGSSGYLDFSATLWWTETSGSYSLNYEPFTDVIDSISTGYPTITPTASPSTLLTAVAAPRNWSVNQANGQIVVVYSTAASATTENIYLQAFGNNGAALSAPGEAFSGVADTTVPGWSMYFGGGQWYFTYQKGSGSGAGVDSQSYNPTTGALGTVYLLSSTTSFSKVTDYWIFGPLSSAAGNDYIQVVEGVANSAGEIQVDLLNSNYGFLSNPENIALSAPTSANNSISYTNVYDPNTGSSDYSVLGYVDGTTMHLDLLDDNGTMIGSGLTVSGVKSLMALHEVGSTSRFEVVYETGATVQEAIYDTANFGQTITLGGGSNTNFDYYYAGTAFDDTFIWEPGAYSVEGGAGNDVLSATALSSSQVQFTLTSNGAVFMSDGASVSDKLRDIETIELSNATYSVNGLTLTLGAGDTFNLATKAAPNDVIAFAGAGDLVIERGRNVGATVAGLGVGAQVDFVDVAYAAGDMVALANNILTVEAKNGVAVASFAYTGTHTVGQFSVSSDAAGGVLLAETS